MQQTILALAAILIFSLFALSRHESDAGRERIAITTEVETAAAGIARERVHTILSRSFDEADIGREGARTRTAGLTPTSSFGGDMGETGEATWDDVDDFHGDTRTETVQWNGRPLEFESTVSVSYFNPATSTRTTGQALAKEITVTVTAAPAGYIGTPPVAATLRRVITPTSNVVH
ncbi:MAG: hypothetical protein AAF791_06505 [Bacteroidota bacterium]